MGLIIFIVFAVALIGFCIWWYLKNGKPNPPQPTPTPDPSSGDTLDSGDTHDSGDTPSSGDTPPELEPVCICESETHKISDCVSHIASHDRIQIGWYENDNMCDCQWSIVGFENGEQFISDIMFEDGKITAIVSETNYGEERTVRCITHLEGTEVSKDDYFDVTQESSIDSKFEILIGAFSKFADIKRSGVTYNYLKELYDEASEQYYNGKSLNSLPSLYVEENFPQIYDFYGDKGDNEATLDTLVGWIIAMQLSELKPKDRTDIFKVGYELGGYDRYSNIYGYKFKNDPNIARLVASAIYVTMRSVKKPDIDAMRTEVGGSKFSGTLDDLRHTNKESVGKDDFYIDFREFMPTAPGPYAPSYTTRPDNTYPTESKDEYKNLQVDRNIHEMVVKNYNLSDSIYYERTVQAIADEEGCTQHLFGDNKSVGNYKFTPVYGVDTIGQRLSPDGAMADFVYDALYASSASRTILQSPNVNPKQYGRLRPGCSWSQEAKKNSSSDDRRNVLCEIDIEDNDGCKDSANSVGYYDKNGVWVHTQVEEDQFCETQKNSLWANSYPSGHSSGIWGAAMVLMELLPQLADKIMIASNKFAVNRTIARYHWNSDTVNGRVLGGATNAVAHAASDYDSLLDKSKKEIEGGDEPAPSDKVNLTLSYTIGGYGSCHVDSGDKELCHCCTKQCDRERHPGITVNQRVNFTIEGGGMTDVNGKTSGVWEANIGYELICPAVTEDKYATITMRNDNGVRVLKYRLSLDGTHDDGACGN